MKKVISLLLALVLVLGLLAGCGSDSTDAEKPETPAAVTDAEPEMPEAETRITDGYYYLDVEVPLSWIHFNEDGTYYAKYFSGSLLESGTWELVDEPTEYYADSNGDGFAAEDERGSVETSEQTMILTPYATGVPQRIAFVDDVLCDMSLGGIANDRFLSHKADYAYDPDVDEIAIQLFVFYANHDIASNFILNHNRTFEDVTGDVYDSGAWEMTGEGTYALTYEFGGTATLTVASDGKTAVLTKEDGSVLELRDTYQAESEAVVQVMSLRAEDVAIPELPMAVNVRIDGYSDGACQLIIEVAAVDAELVADQGTFEVSETMQPSFHFEIAGDLDGTPDYANATADGIPFFVTYSGAVAPEFNGAETAMTVEAEVTGVYAPNATAAEPLVVASIRADDVQVGLPMGVGLRIDCYDDGSAKLIVEIAAVGAELEADQGTYEITASMQFLFRFDVAGDVTGEPDYASATETSIDVHVAYAADVEVEFNGSITPLSIDATLAGTYAIA